MCWHMHVRSCAIMSEIQRRWNTILHMSHWNIWSITRKERRLKFWAMIKVKTMGWRNTAILGSELVNRLFQCLMISSVLIILVFIFFSYWSLKRGCRVQIFLFKGIFVMLLPILCFIHRDCLLFVTLFM